MSATAERQTAADPALERRLERLGLAGHEKEWTDRYLLCNHLLNPPSAEPRQKFEATSRFIRDLVAHRWAKTRSAREQTKPKRIHYLSMEFLLGRTLRNNMMNLAAEPIVRRAMEQEGWSLEQLIEEEPDAGLGNGGLGRLAACFIDSLATLQYPAIGYGLRYEYGIFRQTIRDGWQHEQPDNWLRNTDPWEVVRPGRMYVVSLNAKFELKISGPAITRNRPSRLLGIAFDRPVVGYGAHCINTLRLWAAAAPESFDFAEFSHGDFAGAVMQNVAAESLTRVLYPDDSTEAGRELRFLQQYFMVSCSLQDIIARFRKHKYRLVSAAGTRGHSDERHAPGCGRRRADAYSARSGAAALGSGLGHHAAHAGLYESHAAPGGFGALASRAIRTAHTPAPGDRLRDQPALSRRRSPPVPRRRATRATHEPDRRNAGAEGRMAHLAVVGSHSTNGVAAIHSDLLRTRVLRDFAELFPTRFNNKTNGVTPRRWLQQANPFLSRLITQAIGEDWILDLALLRNLLPLADDSGFREQFRDAKREAKAAFADWLKATSGQIVDPDSIFDSQIKRIHEYKRQLLNVRTS